MVFNEYQSKVAQTYDLNSEDQIFHQILCLSKSVGELAHLTNLFLVFDQSFKLEDIKNLLDNMLFSTTAIASWLGYNLEDLNSDIDNQSTIKGLILPLILQIGMLTLLIQIEKDKSINKFELLKSIFCRLKALGNYFNCPPLEDLASNYFGSNTL